MTLQNELRDIIVKSFLQILLSNHFRFDKKWMIKTQGTSNQSSCNVDFSKAYHAMLLIYLGCLYLNVVLNLQVKKLAYIIKLNIKKHTPLVHHILFEWVSQFFFNFFKPPYYIIRMF